MMIDCAYARWASTSGLPTHAYMGMCDAKIVDAQVRLRVGHRQHHGRPAGVNMISGAGMLDFESCFSLEKLVIDTELVGMAHRLVRGMVERDAWRSTSCARWGTRAISWSRPHAALVPRGTVHPQPGGGPRLSPRVGVKRRAIRRRTRPPARRRGHRRLRTKRDTGRGRARTGDDHAAAARPPEWTIFQNGSNQSQLSNTQKRGAQKCKF